jgi:hypothetical protein
MEGMSKQSRGKSWIDQRLADRLEIDGSAYTVELVARRSTGAPGFRVSVVYLPRGEGPEVQVEQPRAASTADVHRAARELAADPARLEALFRESAGR